MNSFVFVCILGTALMSIPMLTFKHTLIGDHWVFRFAGVFLLSFVVLLAFYYAAWHRSGKAKNRSFLPQFIMFLSLSMGMSLHNALAVIEAWLGRKTPFVRTPKLNIGKGDSGGNILYRSARVSWLTWVELLFAVYFAWGCHLAWVYGDFGLFPYHVLLCAGFGSVSMYGISHALIARRKWMHADEQVQITARS